MPVSDGFPRVAGRCPGCGSASLFLGAGDHITCARLDCSDPTSADRILNDERDLRKYVSSSDLQAIREHGLAGPPSREGR